MPTKPLDIINCTSEELFHQMVIMKNIFKDTVVIDSRGYKHCITTLTKLSAGNTVIPQDFEQTKETQDFISRKHDIKEKARLHLKSVDLGIML